MDEFLNESPDSLAEQGDFTSQKMQGSQFKYIEDQNLIQQKLQIGLNMTVAKYARRPKQVNIAELKNCLQNEVRSL